MLKPIDDLIEHLKGVNPYGKTEAIKLWEALKRLSDTSMRVGAIDGKQIADGTLTFTQLAPGVIVGGDWTTNIAFSASSNTVVAWTSGNIIFGDGTTSGSLAAGSTGTMTTLTYIYYDSNISKTSLQVTTDYKKTVGNGRILLCVARNTVSGQNAFFSPTIGQLGVNETIIGPNSISSSLLQANSVIAAKILAGEVTASKISVTDLSAIKADLGTITAGTVTGAIIRTAATGARIEIDSTNGLRAFNSVGTVITKIPLGGVTTSFINTSGLYGITDDIVMYSNDGTALIACQQTAGGTVVLQAGIYSAAFTSGGNFSASSISSNAVTLDNAGVKVSATYKIYFGGVTTGGNFGGNGNSILGYIGTNEVFRCVDPGTSTTTSSLFLKYNGSPSQILFGAADSGGVGYRLLRVAN